MSTVPDGSGDPGNPYTAANRVAWDAIADKRQKIWPAADFFAEGGSVLDKRDREAAGDVRGLRLCHLQCGSGEEALSWANVGAEVTGVDISSKQVELATAKAAAAGIPADFVAADVFALPRDLLRPASFDIVYTGGGALVWLPDLDRWAATIHGLLKPSGRLIVREEHPVIARVEVREGAITIAADYFDRRPEASTGWCHFPGAKDAPETKWDWTWPLGDIVTSVAQAGLRVERLTEFPSTAAWRFGDDLERLQKLPGSYLLVASKPRDAGQQASV
ncbi:MAG: methyltransferase domain-containing protein [Chloroflexi bacterium]|nr:methyltransferase domain-containing protein [Chloroflexota bacterium]